MGFFLTNTMKKNVTETANEQSLGPDLDVFLSMNQHAHQSQLFPPKKLLSVLLSAQIKKLLSNHDFILLYNH